MVSPTAREIPSTNEATMPDSAAGTTTRVETWSFEAPSPYAPSRSDIGTAIIASSDRDATVGRIMMPITRPAARTLNTWTSMPMSWRNGVTAVSAK